MKLSNSKRDTAIEKVLSVMFSERQNKIEKRGFDIANDVLNHVLDSKYIESIKDGYLPTTSKVNVYLSGYSSFHKLLDTSFKCPYNLYRHDGIQIKEDMITKSLVKMITDLEIDNKTLNDEREQSRAEIRAIFYSVNTTNQLKDVWPEVFDYITFEEIIVPKYEIAPIIDKFNKKLKQALSKG